MRRRTPVFRSHSFIDLSQLAENPKLDLVFRELFAAQGSEIYIRPMTDYVCVGTQLDFHTLIEAAARRGEIAIGYRQIASANDPERSFGVRLNPYKPDPITVGEGDRLIVLAQQ